MSSIDDRLLGDLLALERDYDEMPPGAEARMLGAIVSAVDGGGDGDGGDGGGSGGAGAGAGAGGSVGGGGSGAAMGTTASAMTWLARAAWLGAGVVAGASGHAVLAEKAPAPVTPTASVALTAAASTALAPAPSVSATTIAIDDLPSARTATAAAAAPPAPKSSARIGEERSDLDVARAALARGRVDACLEAIERHVRTYGEGHFAEEREVLAVQALMAAGRRDEALARAARFRAKYPNSLFNPALQKATEKKEPSP